MNNTISIREASHILTTLDSLLTQVRDSPAESGTMRDRKEAQMVVFAVVNNKVTPEVLSTFDYLRRTY